MVKLALLGALAAMLTLTHSTARAQVPDEVASLRTQIELLKKENELLKKEIDLLKNEAKAKPDGARAPKTKASSLSDLLTEGTVLQGTYRATEGGGYGEITVTISERSRNQFKATSVRKQMKDNNDVGTVEEDIEGVIKGARLSWTNVGTANKINATLVLKGEALEGTYKTQAGIVGTIGLKITK